MNQASTDTVRQSLTGETTTVRPPRTNSRVRTYVLYSIGEILLVMIGILLALQVNNWNQNRAMKEELKLSYAKLLIDLENDRKSFERQDSLFVLFEKIAQGIQELLSQNNQTSDLLKMRVLQKKKRLGNVTLDYFNGTYQALVSTGLLYRSKDYETSNKINQYYAEQKDVEENFEDMGVANRLVRDQESLRPFQYIMRTPDAIFSPHPDALQWMNDAQSDTYQSTQYYLSFYIRQQAQRSARINKLLDFNRALQLHLKTIVE